LDLKNQPLGPPKNLGQLERFMETCLLFLLFQSPGHGYSLMQRLCEFGFNEDTHNTGALYNSLRKMEKAGLIESRWEESEQGPRKRVYTISQEGITSLDQWMEILQLKMRDVQKLITRYEESKPREPE